MAWIEQTKKASRKSRGPQYYLQGMSENVKTLLKARRRCPIRLWTPYGVIDTGLQAVSSGVGEVGHDRIQRLRREAHQVAAQVAYWYNLKSSDIETILFEDWVDSDALVMAPQTIQFFGRKAPKKIDRDPNPLTLTRNHQAPALVANIRRAVHSCPACRAWLIDQVAGLVEQHRNPGRNVDERDLLRASGALHRFGLDLGMYRAKGIDCPDARFHFEGHPPYPCPVEIEERSGGFLESHHRQHRGSRAVVLCMEHDKAEALRGYTDVIELRSLGDLLKEYA